VGGNTCVVDAKESVFRVQQYKGNYVAANGSEGFYDQLTAWRRSLIEKLKIPQLAKKLPSSVEAEGTFQCP
jgi:hypothetical protein